MSNKSSTSCWPWFHRWNKWTIQSVDTSYTPIGMIYPADMRGKTFTGTEMRQVRTCERCGKTQIVKVAP